MESRKHYLISVYDTVLGAFLGDCELVNSNGYTIRNLRMQVSGENKLIQYSYGFAEDGTYTRTVDSLKLPTTTE